MKEAEKQTLIRTLKTLYREKKRRDFYLPRRFSSGSEIPLQIPSLLERLGEAESVVSGFALPKFSEKNADDYLKQIEEAGQTYRRRIYAMPILESPGSRLSDRPPRVSRIHPQETGRRGTSDPQCPGGRKRSVPSFRLPQAQR